MKLTRIFQSKKAIAANTAGREAVIGANTEPLPEESGDGWIKIAPYGDFPLHVGKNTLMQRFELANAQGMVDSFNSLVARAGRMFRGLPIYVGHPDVDRASYQDERRLGKIVDLDARADGLYGKPAWNSLGSDNLAQGYWVYPSPAWYYRKPQPGQKVIIPDELKSIGLTNCPNIAASEPVTANADAAVDNDKMRRSNYDPEWVAANFEQPTNQEQDMKLKPETLAALGLTDQSTPEEIAAAVDAAIAKAAADAAASNDAMQKASDAETEACNEKKAKDAAVAACNTARAEHAETLIAVAVNSGKCSKAEADALRPIFATDFAAAKTQLDAMQGTALNTQPLDIGGKRVAINDASQRRAAIAEEVQARMAAHGMPYDVAWNQVKRDPKFAALFAAMQKPEAGK